MKEQETNIWSWLGLGVIAITTNGSLTRDGRAIMGRGVARQAVERFPDLSRQLGALLQQGGNHVHQITPELVSFPVEETAWSLPDLGLIRQSAVELCQLADHQGWTLVVVPRPGCGGGGMRWAEVRPILAGLLDDRFIVVGAPELL